MALNNLPNPTLPNPEPLFYWMQERELIRQLRADGHPRPWTKDPILEGAHFTNVMRDYDRISVWVQKNITDQLCPPGILPLRLAIARWINNTETLSYLIGNGLMPLYGSMDELKLIVASLETIQNSGGKVFGNGYVISAAGMQYAQYSSKIDYAIRGCVGQMVGMRSLPMTRTLREATETLAALPGWGAFMAYEVACDLRWAPGYLMDAPDIYTWANPGPGARRGLKGLGYTGGRNAVQEMHHIALMAATIEWPFEWPRPLEMRDIEHSLCEWGKYRKMELGAPPRRYYRPYASK